MIKLLRDYAIDVTKYGYNLMVDKHRVNKEGKPVYETLGYYTTLEQVVNACRDYIIKMKLRDDVYSLKEALEIIKTCDLDFKKYLKEVLKYDQD